MKSLLLARLLAGAAAIACTATATYAQDASGGQTSGPDAESIPQNEPLQAGAGTIATDPNPTGPAALDEIVVTARRRAENIQDTPLSVTAITDTVLRQKSISTPYDLVAATPGIAATTGSAQRNDVLYFIRGQGATFGSSPSVVTYFAEVPQPTNSTSGGSNYTLFDLDSVQVLKGPQGTLFGRSTTGGAVLLTPKAPSFEFDGFIEATFGNYNTRELNGALNIPIIENVLAVRVAANQAYHDGFSMSLTTGEDLDDRDRISYRVSVLLQPTDFIRNTTIFSDTNIKENGTAAILDIYEPNGLARLVVDPRLPGGSTITGSLLDTRPGGVLGLNVTDPAQAGGLGFISVAGLCRQVAGLYAAVGQTVQDCISQRIGLINGVRASLDSEFARLANGGSVRELRNTRDNFIRSHVQQIINTTEINFGRLGFLGDTTLKNIFSTTRNLRSEAVREIQGGVGSGVVYNNVNVTNPNCTLVLCTGLAQVSDIGLGENDWLDVYTEEVQLAGQINDYHDWIIGYFVEESEVNIYNNFPAVFQTLNGAFTIPAGLPGISTGYNDDYSFKQSGFFGQATIDFADFGFDDLRFTAGYRRSRVTNSLVAVGATINPATGLQRNEASQIPADLKQTADSYTFTLDYKVTPDILAYITTRRGFKQGGINIQSVLPAANGIAAARPTYDPEKVTDYELGLKADYDLGSIAARTNLALFTAEFSDLQRATSFFNGQTTSNQIDNIAGLDSKGIEIEQYFRFFTGFTLNLSYAFLDTEFSEFPGVIVRPSDGAVLERINSPITGAPRHKFDIAPRYVVELDPDVGDVAVSANLSYQSRIITEDDGLFNVTGISQQDAYALVNARLDWNNVMGQPVDIGLFVRNLFDKDYKVGSGGLIASQLGTTTAIYGDPRTFGIQLRARFGASADY